MKTPKTYTKTFFTSCILKNNYSWLSKTWVIHFSNFSIARTNSSVPWTHIFRQKNSQYREYLGRSNKIVGSLDGFLSFSRTFALTFRPKFESSKVRTFYSIFWLKKHITKVFSFLSDVYLRKMAPVKRKLTNRFLAEKCKALKDLENGLLRYKNSLYGRFYIELTKSISYGNNPFIFIVLSPFLENLNSR